MTGRPLILLDVDGPLNPWARKPTRRDELPLPYETHRLRPAGFENARKPLRVWLSREHGPMLLNLAERTGGELVWATTWEHDANRMIGPAIGLPELPVIEFGEHPGTLAGWKYPAVATYAVDRPLLWFDDDFDEPRYRDAKAAFLHGRGEEPTNLFQVPPADGLTGLDMHAADDWLAESAPTPRTVQR